MIKYAFWNNKGGTGKTSLSFQCICRYAELHPHEKILAIDLCPQANLSELFMGGLSGNGATNLQGLYANSPRKSIGGYFDNRILSPFTMPPVNAANYICKPYSRNRNIPLNVDLIAGDSIVELQAPYMSSSSNGTLPNGQSPYALVLGWLTDLLVQIENEYNVVFIDTNPSFSIYTQIAMAAAEKLIIPVMADDSSRRALDNVLSLLYGYNTPVAYAVTNFNSVMVGNAMPLPQIHMVVKNRITQYMGPASGYYAVLRSIDEIVNQAKVNRPDFFSADFSIESVRDFQTTGVIAFAEAKTFNKLLAEPLNHNINGKNTHLNRPYIQQNLDDIDVIVAKL